MDIEEAAFCVSNMINLRIWQKLEQKLDVSYSGNQSGLSILILKQNNNNNKAKETKNHTNIYKGPNQTKTTSLRCGRRSAAAGRKILASSVLGICVIATSEPAWGWAGHALPFRPFSSFTRLGFPRGAHFLNHLEQRGRRDWGKLFRNERCNIDLLVDSFNDFLKCTYKVRSLMMTLSFAHVQFLPPSSSSLLCLSPPAPSLPHSLLMLSCHTYICVRLHAYLHIYLNHNPGRKYMPYFGLCLFVCCPLRSLVTSPPPVSPLPCIVFCVIPLLLLYYMYCFAPLLICFSGWIHSGRPQPHCVSQIKLEFSILSQWPKFLDYWCVPPCSVSFLFLFLCFILFFETIIATFLPSVI